MTPQALADFLGQLVAHKLFFSTMIWGPPGIGKSSIVAQTAAAHGLECIDVRLSQLAPTDLRGLPVPEDGLSRWYPPEFLPRQGAGILFLDEVNLAPPAMQGMAQQLILDRRVGSYVVPEGWFIWAAGNRKEDRAAVFDMPAPLANRFIHLVVEPDFESFKAFALTHNIHEQILAFLAFRPELLHKLDPHQPAWPSPRSWLVASALHRVGLPIVPVVGAAATAEFDAFSMQYANLPDIERILQGQGKEIPFPAEPSVRFATAIGLTLRAADIQQSYQAFRWMIQGAPTEWVQMFSLDMMRVATSRNERGRLAVMAQADPELRRYLEDYVQLVSE
jgi:hypothetical protein